MAEKIALIAGAGSLPILVAQAARDQHKDIFIIPLKGIADPTWLGSYPHEWVGLAKFGHLYATFKKEKITHVIMAGHVTRPSFSELIPDWTGIKTVYRMKHHHMQGDDGILRFIADDIERQGVTVIGADQVYSDGLMPQGILTKRSPSTEDWADINHALPIIADWAEKDIGQSIVVQQKLIIGVEAIEGTGKLIERCGTYKRSGRAPILVKIKKPQQDRRLDLPTIGPETIRQAVAAGFSGIAVEADNAMFLHAAQAVDEANKHGLFIVGIKPDAGEE